MVKSHILKKVLLIGSTFTTPLMAVDFSPVESMHFSSSKRKREQNSVVANAAFDTYENVKKGIAETVKDVKKLIPYVKERNLHQIMPDFLTSTLNLAFAEFMGEGFHEFLHAEPGKLNPVIVAKLVSKIQLKIFDTLYDLTHKTTDYVYDEKGKKRFVIKGGSFFKSILELTGVQALPFGSILIKALDMDIVKTFLTQKMNLLIINSLDKLLEHKGISSIEKLVGEGAWLSLQGGAFVTMKAPGAAYDISKQVYKSAWEDYAPVAYDADALAKAEETYGPLWTYLEPKLSYYTRETIISSLVKAEETALNTARDMLKKKAKPALGSLGAIGFGVGNLFGFGSLGYGTMAALGIGVWKTGDMYIDSLFEEGKHTLNKQIQHIMYSYVPLGEKEHLLYGLNPNPSEVEKLLFATDYQKREELMAKTFIGAIIKQIMQSSGAEYVLATFGSGLATTGQWSLNQFQNLVGIFSKTPDISLEEAFQQLGVEEEPTILAHLEAEKIGFRQYVYLKNKKKRTEAEQQILNNIEKYPSYKLREIELRTLQHQQTVFYGSTDQVQQYTTEFADSIKKAKEREAIEKKAIADISFVSYMLFKMSPHSYAQDLILKKSFKKAILKRSIRDQDLIGSIPGNWMQKYGEENLSSLDSPDNVDEFLLNLMNTYTAETDLSREFSEHRQEINGLKQYPIFQHYSDYTLLDLLKEKRDILEQEGLLDNTFQTRIQEQTKIVEESAHYLEKEILTELELQYTNKILQDIYGNPENIEELITNIKEGYQDYTTDQIKEEISFIKTQYPDIAPFFEDTKEALEKDINESESVIIYDHNNLDEPEGSEFEVVTSLEAHSKDIKNNFMANKLFMDFYSHPNFIKLLETESDALKYAVYNRLLTDSKGMVEESFDYKPVFETPSTDFTKISEVFIKDDFFEQPLPLAERLAKVRIIHAFNMWNSEKNLSFTDFLTNRGKFIDDYTAKTLQTKVYNPLLAKLEL